MDSVARGLYEEQEGRPLFELGLHDHAYRGLHDDRPVRMDQSDLQMTARFFCDRCDEQVASSGHFIRLKLGDTAGGKFHHELKAVAEIEDICLNCTREIVDFIARKGRMVKP